MSSSAAMCTRLAPRAHLKDSSRRRATARASSRLAILQQATTTSAAALTNNNVRKRVVASHRPGKKRARRAGNAARRRAPLASPPSTLRSTAPKAALTVSIDPRSGKRPTAIKLTNPGLVRIGRPATRSNTDSGRNTSMDESPYQSSKMPRKSSGVTPTILAGTPLRMIGRPMTSLWPANASRHNRRRSRPAFHQLDRASGSKRRPITADVPRTWRYEPDTKSPMSRCFP